MTRPVRCDVEAIGELDPLTVFVRPPARGRHRPARSPAPLVGYLSARRLRSTERPTALDVHGGPSVASGLGLHHVRAGEVVRQVTDILAIDVIQTTQIAGAREKVIDIVLGE